MHRLAPDNAARFRDRREGKPVPDASQAAARSPGADRTAVRAGRGAWHLARPNPLPTAAWLVARPWSAGRVLRDAAPPLAGVEWSPRPPRMKRLTHVIEFRHPSWYVADTFQALADAGVALCLHDKRGSEIAEPAVGPAVYVRFLGTSGQYHGSYSDKVLGRWARRPSRAPAGRYAGVCVLQQRPGRGGGQKRADPTSLMAGSASTRHVPVDA